MGMVVQLIVMFESGTWRVTPGHRVTFGRSRTCDVVLPHEDVSPGPVAALGGLGIAGIAAFLLDFNHPVDASFLDLAWHAVAVGFVFLATSTAAKLPRAFRPSARRRAQREHK